MAHGALLEYGFILRYPPEKSHITGISYEPWHYRYVGGRPRSPCRTAVSVWRNTLRRHRRNKQQTLALLFLWGASFLLGLLLALLIT